MSLQQHSTCRVIGYRGAPVLAPPGNTVASLKKGIEVGAQMLAVDVRRTRDDVLVLEHDAFRVVANKDTPIEALTFAQWQAYTQETEAPMTSLEQGFRVAKEFHVGLMLEMKEAGTEALLARAVRSSGLPLQTFLITGAGEASRKILRALDPRIPLSHSLDLENAPAAMASLLAEIDTEAVTWHPKLLTPGVVKVFQKRRIACYAWEADLLEEMRRLRDIGVNGIVTNFPEFSSIL
jgi:glycerophosphoryl diester phosphodiesterase